MKLKDKVEKFIKENKYWGIPNEECYLLRISEIELNQNLEFRYNSRCNFLSIKNLIKPNVIYFLYH